MPHSRKVRPHRRKRWQTPALAATAFLALSPAAQAGFSVQGSVHDITFTALDMNDQPAGDGLFTLGGAGVIDNFAVVASAQGTDPSNLWTDYRNTVVPWSGSTTTLPPAGLTAQLSGSSAFASYQVTIDSAGLSLQGSASGDTRYVGLSADLGPQRYDQTLLSLAPHTILRIDSSVDYTLQQGGSCNASACDAAFVQATIFVVNPDGSAGGNSVYAGITAAAADANGNVIGNTGYASFLGLQTRSATASESLSGWLVNDSDSWANYAFYIELQGSGASITAVPAPASAWLMLAGLLGTGMRARRRGAGAAGAR